MKTKIKQILAGLLVAVMLFSSAPLEALTGIDFGSLFEVEAEAASYSKIMLNVPWYAQMKGDSDCAISS